MWGDCELIVLVSWYFLKSLAQSLLTTTVRHIMKHCLGPWGLSRPIASGLFTAWQIFEFWTEGRTDLQQDSKFSSWRVDSKYISNKKIGQRVPEILSSKGKTLFQGKIQAKKSRPNSGHSGSIIELFLTYSENIGQMLRACKISPS